MQEVIQPLLWLVLLVIVFTVMLRPVAPGFSNAVNQQLGSCVGRLASIGIALIVIAAVGAALLQLVARSCSWHGAQPSTTAQQTQSGTGTWPLQPGIPEPPDDISATLAAGRVAFSWPVQPYSAGSYNGRDFYASGHIGEDLRLAHGTPVHAAADGVVVLSRTAQGYGHVVVVEHYLPDGWVLLTIYGHLATRARCQQQGLEPSPTVGTAVMRGKCIGWVGWDDANPQGVAGRTDGAENGDGGEHLHMGLRDCGRDPDPLQRDYRDRYYMHAPYAKGQSWFRGYAAAGVNDRGQLDASGTPSGGQYLSFTQFMRYGYRGLVYAVPGQ